MVRAPSAHAGLPMTSRAAYRPIPPDVVLTNPKWSTAAGVEVWHARTNAVLGLFKNDADGNTAAHRMAVQPILDAGMGEWKDGGYVAFDVETQRRNGVVFDERNGWFRKTAGGGAS